MKNENVESAIASLKAKLGLLGGEDEAVALANFTPGSSKITYQAASISNIDWDPKDHPRDPHTGEFMKTPSGFLWGKAKKASFPLGWQKPQLTLKPGDVVFKTPGGNIAVSHGDDSWTLYTKSNPSGTTIPDGSQNDLVAKYVTEGSLQKIGENPAVAVEASSQAEAEAKLANPSAPEAADTTTGKVKKTYVTTFPDGTTSESGSTKPFTHAVIAKSPDGTWQVWQHSGSAALAEKYKNDWKQKSASGLGDFADGKASTDFQVVETTIKEEKPKKTAVTALKDKVEEPEAPAAPSVYNEGQIVPGASVPPAFKNGKTTYTAKQITEYQEANKGVPLGVDKDGKPILSGSWIDVDGKPVQVHASPYGGVTGYRWVQTKQQASNLSKEDLVDLADLPKATAIDDPTGKPYGVKTEAAPDQVKIGTGSIMSQAVVGKVPNTSVKHKTYVEDHAGDVLDIKDTNGVSLKSGDWVEIEGKPFQIHVSPNEGNISLAKWVSTKKQKSNNTYDFPKGAITGATKIEDPTGTDYTPIQKSDSGKQSDDSGTWPTTGKYDPNFKPALPKPTNFTGTETMTSVEALKPFVFDWALDDTLFNEAEDPESFKQTAALQKSIAENGFNAPVTMRLNDDGTMVLQDGNHRFAAALKLGLKEIPVDWVNENGESIPAPDLTAAPLPDQGPDASDHWTFKNYEGKESSASKVGEGWKLTIKGQGSYNYTADEFDDMFGGLADLKAVDADPDYNKAPEKKSLDQIAAEAVADTKNVKPKNPVPASGYKATVKDFDDVPVGTKLQFENAISANLYIKTEDGWFAVNDNGDLSSKPAKNLKQTVGTTISPALATFIPPEGAPVGSVTTSPSGLGYKKKADGNWYSTLTGEKTDSAPNEKNWADVQAVIDAEPTQAEADEAEAYLKSLIDDPDINISESDLVGAEEPLMEWEKELLGQIAAQEAAAPTPTNDPNDSKSWKITLQTGQGETIFTENSDGSWTGVGTKSGYEDDFTKDEFLDMFYDPKYVVTPHNAAYKSIEQTLEDQYQELVKDGDANAVAEVGKNAAGPAQAAAQKVIQEHVDSGFLGQSFLAKAGIEDDAPEPAAPVEVEVVEGENVFVHPLSGESQVLKPGDKVYKSKVNENAYIVVVSGSDTPYQYFNTQGKKYKPKAEQKSFEKNYTETSDWPGKKGGETQTDTGATQEDAGDLEATETMVKASLPGDVVKFHNEFSTPTYVKQSDGWHKIDADGNTTSKAYENTEIIGALEISPKTTFHPNVGAAEVEVTESPEILSDLFAAAVPGDLIQLKSPYGDSHWYVKDANGWKKVGETGQVYDADGDGLLSAINLIDYDTGDSTYETTFHKQNYPDDLPQAGKEYVKKAPWGGSEALGDTDGSGAKEKAKKAAPAPKKGGKAALPTTFKIGATDIDLKPGELLVEGTNNNGEKYYYLVSPLSNGGKYKPSTNKFFDSAGVQHSIDWSDSIQDPYKWSPAQAKTQVKKSNLGYKIVAAKEMPKKKEAADFSGYTPWAEFPAGWTASTGANYKAEHIAQNAPLGLPQTYYGTFSKNAEIPGTDPLVNWYNATPEQKLQVLAGMSDFAGAGYAGVETLVSDNNDKSEKAAVTKFKNGFALLHRLAALAAALQDPENSGWTDDDFESEIAFFQQKAASPSAAYGKALADRFPQDDFQVVLNNAYTQYQFKQSLTGLSFDPYNATTEDYDTYAKAQGFDLLAALPEDQQKVWVLNNLGDPTLTNAQKSTLNQHVKQTKKKVGLASVLAGIAPKIGKKENQPAPIPGAHSKVSLKSKYTWEGTNGEEVTLTHTGTNDEWVLKSSGLPDTLTFTDAVAMGMVNHAMAGGVSNFTASDDLAYSGDVAKSMKAVLDNYGGYANTVSDLSQPDIAAALTGLGLGDVLPYLAASGTRRRLLTMHLAGDHVGEYQILAQNLPTNSDLLKSHPGNPSTPTGQNSLTALKAFLLSTSWGTEYLQTGEDPRYGTYSSEFSEWSAQTYGSANNLAWVNYHPVSVFQNVSGTPATSGGSPHAVKPFNVSDADWDLVAGVDENTDLTPIFSGAPVEFMTASQVDYALAQSSSAKNAGIIAPTLGGVPLHIKKLALWSESEGEPGIMLAIAAKIKAGEFLDDATPVWIAPDGQKFPISPGSKVYEYNGNYYVSGPPNADGTPSTQAGYQITATGAIKAVGAGSMQSVAQAGETVFSMPNPVTYAVASGLVDNLPLDLFNHVASVEEGKTNVYSGQGNGSILTAYLKTHKKLQEYPALYAQHVTLPEHVKHLLASTLDKLASGDSGQEVVLDLMEVKAAKGHYGSMQAKGLYDPQAPWLPNLSLGQVNESDVLSKWTPAAKDAYLKQFGLSDHGQIPEHLDALLNPKTGGAPKALPSFKDLVLTPTGKTLGGMHTKKVWVDQYGNEYMSKGFDSDPNAKMRVDAEIASIQIGHLYGFYVPTAGNLQEVPGQGQYAYLQHLVPGGSDLVGKGPNDLTVKQLSAAMEAHLHDWITANHDSHQENLRLDENGGLYGIDKGQAFKHFPNDKLAVGYLPPENGAPVWYDKFYNALQKGQISKETADAVTTAVLRKAFLISKDKDDEYRAQLTEAFQHRTAFPSPYDTREKFIDALVERKHNSFDDFVEFYKNLYAASPYDFDIDTENLAPSILGDHSHLAVSQQFADDVSKAKAYGKSIFFDSTHFEDGRFLVSTVEEQDGGTTLFGEAKIRKDGDKLLSKWLQQQTVTHATSGYQQSHTPPAPVDTDDPTAMPGIAEFHAYIVAGSKTVSSHAPNGGSNPDGKYNASTLQAMEQQVAKIKEILTELDFAQKDGELADFTKGGVEVKMHTQEQQDAYEAMLKQMLNNVESVEQAKATGTKVSPHFTQPSYTPSAAAKQAFKDKKDAEKKAKDSKFADGKALVDWAKAAQKEFKDNGGEKPYITYKKPNGEEVTYVYNVNGPGAGTWVHQDSDDHIGTNAYMADYFDQKGWIPVDTGTQGDTTTTVQIGSKLLQVTLKQASLKKGELDPKTGVLKITNQKSSQVGYSENWLNTGQMYEIDFGNTVIEYRPWEGTGTKKAQRGLLRFYKKDWAGDSDSIDEVMDVLRQMGLDLDPATEESMEATYWRVMTDTLRDRNVTAKYQTVLNDVDAEWKSNPTMSTADETAMLKQAWAKAIGQDRVDAADWEPKFSRWDTTLHKDDPEFTTGAPTWTKPDVTLQDMKKYYGNTLPMTSIGNEYMLAEMLDGGGFMSTEERMRVLAQEYGGASSDSDQAKGSSHYLFLRQNIKPGGSLSLGSWNASVLMHPRVAMRSSTYTYSTDHYGNSDLKKSEAYWDAQQAASHKGSGNEMMVQNGVSALDDVLCVIFPSAKLREEAIKNYHEKGITSLHGLPLEEVFVTSTSAANALIPKLWDNILKLDKEEKEASK